MMRLFSNLADVRKVRKERIATNKEKFERLTNIEGSSDEGLKDEEHMYQVS